MAVNCKEESAFKIGEVIMHNKLGLCTLQEMTKINDMDYYVLISNRDNTKIMIPVISGKKLIRKIITKRELDELISRMQNTEVDLIADFKARAKKYEELLKSGETENLLILLRMINQQQKQKNRLSVADKEISKAAKKLLFDELMYVLNAKTEEVEKYLFRVDTCK